MSERTDQGEFVRVLGAKWHVLAHFDAGYIRRDGREFAPHFGFRIRFGGQGVMVTGSATGPDENAIRLGAVV